ncbi:hypothetical protein SCUCBS95973_003180 [Sporothrix curviconia]|uniref:FAD-binding domain-containing protein n=1 Tax=Sporothrix curviconia TaxID=1260050 RepID=A0ABP0BD06_9PEZI
MGSVANHYSVIVVGAGAVGLATALNLARANVQVLIVERGKGIDQSPRATSYQPCVMAEMEETGILDDVRQRSMVNDVLSLWVGRGPQKTCVASVTKREGGQTYTSGINCGQPILAETIMDHLLTRYTTAEVRFSQRVDALAQDASTVKVTCVDDQGHTTIYTCDWLVGADGAGSTVRRLLDIDFEGFSWPKEDFVATNLRYPFRDYGFSSANFVMDTEHWGVVTVIDNTGLWRCAFGVRPGLTNDQIRAELDDHYKHILPGWPGNGYELVDLNKYKPHQRCAATFRKGRCLLAGDAAHSNNPLGGLGLTSGLLDAGPLGRALAAVIIKKAPEALLDVWAQARRHKWLTYTNPFSIENKRMVQRAGYSEDPLGIWVMDDVAREHHMEQWIATATEAKREEDEKLFEQFKDPEAQLASRMKQWSITMHPLWMAEYEDDAVVKKRLSLRPPNEQLEPVEPLKPAATN